MFILIYFAFPIWTIAQGNQIVDEKLVVLLIYEEEMIELGHPHFATPDDSSRSDDDHQWLLISQKGRQKDTCVPLDEGTQYWF